MLLTEPWHGQINLAGLGFAGLDPGYETQVKLGVLGGSLIAGLLGTALLLAPARSR